MTAMVRGRTRHRTRPEVTTGMATVVLQRRETEPAPSPPPDRSTPCDAVALLSAPTGHRRQTLATQGFTTHRRPARVFVHPTTEETP